MAQEENVFEIVAYDDFGNVVMSDYVIVNIGQQVLSAAPASFKAATRFGLSVVAKKVQQEEEEN